MKRDLPPVPEIVGFRPSKVNRSLLAKLAKRNPDKGWSASINEALTQYYLPKVGTKKDFNLAISGK